MITLEQPSMALNDSYHAHLTVNMWNTWAVTDRDSSQHIINWVASVARSAPGGKLKNVVFACHGSPGQVKMGGQGFSRANTILFSSWAGLVEKIWFRACEVAFIHDRETNSDGNLFCSEVAKNAQCYVVASIAPQWTRPSRVESIFKHGHHTLPYGQLDSFEGLVFSYGPDGKINWSHHYEGNSNANNE